MTEPLADTWHSRDLPVLRVVCETLDRAAGGAMGPGRIPERTGLDESDVRRALANLDRSGRIRGKKVAGGEYGLITDVSEQALRDVGMWPTPDGALDRMIEALERLANDADQDDDTRTRARKALDAFTSGSRTVGLSVATAVITGHFPGN